MSTLLQHLPRPLRIATQVLALAVALAGATACSTASRALTENCEFDRDVSRTCVPDSKDRDPLPNTVARYGTRSMEEYVTRRGACRKATDDEFLRAFLCLCKGDRECVLTTVVQLGWDSARQSDPTVAMRRFNQAWLVNPDSARVYWGFGTVYGHRLEFDQAAEMFDHAVQLSVANGQLPALELSRLYCDFGFTLLQAAEKGAPETARVYWERAGDLFQKSKDTHRDSGCCTYWKWALALFRLGEYEASWKKVHLSQSHEKQCPLPLLDDLRKAMPEPRQ